MKLQHIITCAAILAWADPASSQDDPHIDYESLQPEMAAATHLGKQVLAFCAERVGVKVGDGQCATLAVQALAAARGRGMGRDFPNRGDYVWGRQVVLIEAERKGVKGLISLAAVKAGDIVQFRDARLEGVNRNGGGTYWMSAPHHTAVVAAVDPNKSTLVVYHQNWGKKIVRKDVMYLPDLKSGWLRIYRPIAAR